MKHAAKILLLLVLITTVFSSAALAELPTGNPDLDIIMRDGHPTYLGSMGLAHKIWDDVDAKVDFDERFHPVPEILSLDSRANDLIDWLIIKLSDFDVYPQLSLDQALTITKEYMPLDHLAANYDFDRAYALEPTEKASQNPSYYVIEYRRKESVSQDRDSPFSLSPAQTIQLELNADGYVDMISFATSSYRWFFRADEHGYKKIDWNVDLALIN